MDKIDSSTLDPKFKRDVATQAGGENLRLCFACGTCTAACPVSAIDPEFNPRLLIRQILLGMRKETLSSPAIWRCVQCYSCTAKCPQNVRFREIVRALREMAVKEGLADVALLAEADEVGRLVQKVRRDVMNALATERPQGLALKQKLADLANPAK